MMTLLEEKPSKKAMQDKIKDFCVTKAHTDKGPRYLEVDKGNDIMDIQVGQ